MDLSIKKTALNAKGEGISLPLSVYLRSFFCLMPPVGQQVMQIIHHLFPRSGLLLPGPLFYKKN